MDEADRMVNLGFEADLTFILDKLPHDTMEGEDLGEQMDVDGETPISPAGPSSFSSSSISLLLSDSSSPPQRTMTRRDFNEISARLDALEKEINSIDDAVLQRENELRDEFENELRSREEELMEHVDKETRVGREGRGSDGEGRGGER